jgi:hypothetical protein
MDRASGALDATAELVSVEQCSEPDPRPGTRGILNTAPPGRAGRWRGVPRGPTFWLRTRLHAGEQRGGPGAVDERPA